MRSISLLPVSTIRVVPSLDMETSKKENNFPSKDQKAVLKRAAAPKHWGAAMAKTLRALVSSDGAEVDRLKDEAKSALDAYNTAPTDENKANFIQAFKNLDKKTPDAEVPSAILSWGQMDNPAYGKFMKKTEKLRAAYNILKPSEPNS